MLLQCQQKHFTSVTFVSSNIFLITDKMKVGVCPEEKSTDYTSHRGHYGKIHSYYGPASFDRFCFEKSCLFDADCEGNLKCCPQDCYGEGQKFKCKSPQG